MSGFTNYEEVLKNDKVLVQNTVGVSMLPLLRQNRDTVVIEKIDGKPSVNDVVFYKRDNGQYVLHRLIKIKDNSYVIRGDNCYANEYNVTDRHILGVLKEIHRDDEIIDCKTSKKYKIYVFFRKYTYYPRKLLVFIRRVLGKIKRMIVK